jgi:hypothetical protein
MFVNPRSLSLSVVLDSITDRKKFTFRKSHKMIFHI